MKQVRETKPGKSLSAWVILKDGKRVATVQAAYLDSGSVWVDVWDDAKGEISKQGRAGGGGYDKFMAALSGAVIDGHVITDHCGARLPFPDGLKCFPEDFKAPAGYHLANWIRGDLGGDFQKMQGYRDCYKSPGLRYLEEIGYQVIQAI